MKYDEFINQKTFDDVCSGFTIKELNSALFPFQDALVRWALARGRAAIFADTGLGKTFMQCEWAYQVVLHTDKPVIIFAPLAVAKQTQENAAEFGIEVIYLRKQPDILPAGVYVTNYEMQQHFNSDDFIGVVLDESSILKNQMGSTRREMISKWGICPYRLSCTATPSPNDFMELGNQSEFIGIMSMVEMLAMFFVNDTGNTGTWRLKGHGKARFWEWLSTWAAVIRKPSDIGFSDEGYDLPPLNIIEHEVQVAIPMEGELFAKPAQTLSERRQAKRDSLQQRVNVAADLVNKSDEAWIVWCYLNDESAALSHAILDGVEVKGADKMDDKESRLLSFQHGDEHCLITKPSIAGFGMNFQHTRNHVFVGLDDSFEKYYQAIRRQYRFGQKQQVNSHIVISDGEGAIKENIERNQEQHNDRTDEMVVHMREFMKREINGAQVEKTSYNPQQKMELPQWI